MPRPQQVRPRAEGLAPGAGQRLQAQQAVRHLDAANLPCLADHACRSASPRWHRHAAALAAGGPKARPPGRSRASGVGRRALGVGNRESGIGNRVSGVRGRETVGLRRWDNGQRATGTVPPCLPPRAGHVCPAWPGDARPVRHMGGVAGPGAAMRPLGAGAAGLGAPERNAAMRWPSRPDAVCAPGLAGRLGALPSGRAHARGLAQAAARALGRVFASPQARRFCFFHAAGKSQAAGRAAPCRAVAWPAVAGGLRRGRYIFRPEAVLRGQAGLAARLATPFNLAYATCHEPPAYADIACP